MSAIVFIMPETSKKYSYSDELKKYLLKSLFFEETFTFQSYVQLGQKKSNTVRRITQQILPVAQQINLFLKLEVKPYPLK